MTTVPRPGVSARRPRNSLTPEAIIAAAFAVSARAGGSGLTFAAIGAEVGAHPTAVYRHFRDKDDLMLGLIDALHAEVLAEAGPPRPDWRDELRAITLTMHRVFLRHPGIAQHAAVRTARRRHEFLVVERVIAAVRAAGFDDVDAARYYRVVSDASLSYCANDAALAALAPQVRQGDLDAWSSDYRALPPSEFPNIAATLAHVPALDDDANFATLLELLIAALEQRARAARRATRN